MASSAANAPPHPHPHARVSLEEREVHRIYHPWLSAHGSSLNVANHVDSLAQDDLQESGYEARSSRDKALTAYAQLVALRLDVKRCMISLIDTSNQYILAEATRTVSIASSRTAEDDELWLGTAVLSRPDAVCEHCFINTCTAVDDCGATLTAKGLVVPDCRLDERFKDRPYVLSEPGVRFYAGVPIYSRNGYMIGACAVSDDSPRANLKVDELRLMQETAQSVIEHLECKCRCDTCFPRSVLALESTCRMGSLAPVETRRTCAFLRQRVHPLSSQPHGSLLYCCEVPAWMTLLHEIMFQHVRCLRC
jgi:hypothetical protein